MECPKCDGAMWDNREKVNGGWKGPLWKCKDKGCEHVIWPPKGDRKAAGNGKPQSPKHTWAELSVTYRRCLLIAQKHVGEVLPKALPTDTIAAAACLFIEANRGGVAEPVKDQPLHEKPRVIQEAEDELDSDIPF